MLKTNLQTNLRDAILLLENNREEEEKLLRLQFHITYESLKPISLIKSTFNEAVSSPELKDNIFNTSIGLTAGYLAKQVFLRISKSPVKKLIGSALMLSITKVVAKNPETIKVLGTELLKSIREKISNRAKKNNKTETIAWE